MHRAIVEARLGLMRGTAFEDLVSAVAGWFAAHDDCLEAPIVPRLLHMDLHPGNVLVRNGRVTGILDVEESIVGHNEYDLMRTELGNFRDAPPEYRRAFMDAYTARIALDEGYGGRRRFYDLSRTLAWIDSLIRHGDRHAMGPAASAHALRLVSGAEPGTPP
jgi:aminoglycoside phosphotransferase (APT) family kinase protein